MKRAIRFGLLSGLLAALNFFLPVHLFADSSSYFDMDAASVIPIKNNSIVMQREVVRIKPKSITTSLSWFASCDFVFYNKSNKKETITMGYPDWLNDTYDPTQDRKFQAYFGTLPPEIQEHDKEEYAAGYGWDDVYFQGYEKGKLPYITDAWNLHDLTLKINGESITNFRHKAVRLKHMRTNNLQSVWENMPEGAFVWKAEFGPHETKTAQITFDFAGLTDVEYHESVYLLTTGALWADKIGTADIYWDITNVKQWDIGDVNLQASGPGGFKIEDGGNMLHWHFENFKPKEDIVLIIGDARNIPDEGISNLIETFCSKKYDGNSRDYNQNDPIYRAKGYKGPNFPRLYIKALRNEICARHGREFHAEDLREIFGSCGWYKPTPVYSDKLLNSYEWKNIKFLQGYEKQQGWGGMK